MDNRFGIKDLFLFALLIGIVAILVLAIVQYDRQWGQIQELKSGVSNLATDIATLRRQMADRPVVVAPTDPGTAQTPAKDPFRPMREAEAMPDFARGDWLVENFGTNIGKLTPLISTDVYAAWVQAKTLESLAYRDPDTLKYVPLLAERWDVSPDGKTMTFDLRRNVVFSDGTPMTAADVVFTFNHIRNPEIDAPRARAYMKDLESITAEGDYRVVFQWSAFTFNAFSTVVETLILPEHFYSRFTPREYNERPGLVMGTGPYRLPTPDQWTPGTRVELVRNERYWGVPPAFDKLVYYEVKDDVAEETMFRNREIDRFASTPEQYEKLKDDEGFKQRTTQWQYYSPVSGYTYVGWNQRKKDGDSFRPTIFADKRVRQAMTMLLDRQRLADEIYYGHAQPATGPFGFGSPQTDPAIQAWPFDPERAKALLREVGFEDRNRDGTLEDAAGVPLEFTLLYPAGNPFTDRIVLFMKDSFARVGVKMNLDAVDWPVMLQKLDTRDFEACTLGWSTSIETDVNQIFHSAQTKDSGDNFINYVNPELDAAIDAARSTVDEDERMLAWRRVHAILHEDQPYTFMLNRKALVFIDNRIRNIRLTPMGLNMVLTELMPLPWYVPQSEQLHKTAN